MKVKKRLLEKILFVVILTAQNLDFETRVIIGYYSSYVIRHAFRGYTYT